MIDMFFSLHIGRYNEPEKIKLSYSIYYKIVNLLKLPDIFSIALWKFYHKLMNNKLPECFSKIKPKLPEIIEHDEIRNPVFHLPDVKRK